MKKLLTIAAFLAAATLSYGQGTVSFTAGGTAATRVSTNSAVGGATTGLTGRNDQSYSYYYALFVADSTITSAGTIGASGALDPTRTAGWSLATWAAGNASGQVGGVYGTNVNAGGRLNGNPTTDNVSINGRAAGSSVSFVVVGWSSQVAGQNWANAQTYIDYVLDNGNNGNGPTTGWIGASAVATSVTLAAPPSPSPNIFGTSAGQIAGFNLLMNAPVPEPSSFALAGLGAAVMLIFRRRKN
jgi:hypothetical protein